jgi:putative glutamine amidotransferase
LLKPIIGITPSPSDDEFGHGTFHRYAIASTYTEAIEAAGGVPVVLPPQHANVPELLSVLDGVLLSGGGDLRPDRYGDPEVHPTTYGIHDLRDQFEIDLVHGVVRQDIPTLCICRGIQVLNVALGGTLIQDISDQYSRDIAHGQRSIGIPREKPSHDVTIVPDSLLHTVYGGSVVKTNSFHHQALKDVSPQLCVLARTADGVVEAVGRPGMCWLLGVQWHPEMMFQSHPEHLKPFEALVRAAIERRERLALASTATGQ